MSNEQDRRSALVTGASAGIGERFARALAARGHDLVLTARRESRLQMVAHEVEQRHGVRVLVVAADLADPEAPAQLVQHARDEGFSLDVVINNAGYAVGGHFDQSPWQTHADFLQVMLISLTQLCHLTLPQMKNRGYGRVINVASLAGLVPGSAGHTLYGATKSFVVKLSESLAAEHAGSGVHVTASCPGFTYSEFHDVLGNREQVSRLPDYYWMDAQEVVEASLDACDRGEVVMVPGTVNKLLAGLSKALPAPLARKMMTRRSSQIRKQH